MTNVSCGVLILTPSNRILLAHTTNAPDQRGWTIPKGLRDEGEESVHAALRELQEETGIILTEGSHQLEVLGEFTYLKEKNIFLVVYRAAENEFDCSTLDCISLFEMKVGKRTFMQKEVDDFKFVGFDQAVKRDLSPTLSKLLDTLRDRILK